ncbi:zinc finger protein 2-like isoform X2 [Zootermopsis nevadensis]|uniref:zinc finger protein 2-like isoform X2 n=1 Tax=Zootermopsis nevadensis TaxID=136037 RepID=UPI000B8E3CD4|nr:zinc finger protein 2-like isoform X2 [Zootermopsis nevadensis]
MESCSGTPTSSETGVAATVTSTSTTATATTNVSLSNGGAHGEEDEDSNFDRLTQMLPECFVSVKLENNEDTCSAEISTNTVSPIQDTVRKGTSSGCPEVLSEPAPSKSVSLDMQNSQHTTGTGSRVAPCFHHRGTMGCSAIPEMPPWLQQCYTTGQISGSDSCQQGPQHFHQSAMYFSHEGPIIQGDRSLKSGGGISRIDTTPAGIGGLSNGDICDSNTFLNYVLNQQRSSGIFLFDPIRTLHPNEPSTETSEHESNTNTESTKHQNLNHKHTSDASVKRNNSPPSSIAPVEGNPSRRDAATNTVSKYAQTIPLLPLNSDAKTNVGDHLDDGDIPMTRIQSKACHLRHCTKCIMSKISHMCHDERTLQAQDESGGQSLTANFTVSGACQKIINMRNCSTVGCGNHIADAKAESGKVQTNFVVISTDGSSDISPQQGQQCNHGSCSCLAENTRNLTGHAVKTEDLSAHNFGGTDSNGKFGNMQLGHGVVTDCKCMNDCSSMCIKDNRRLHYVDIDRPFTCEICFKNYPTSTALMNHMRYHRGQRPYQCEVCNKAFATNSHLVTHRRVHTGERPFQCRLCRRSFADRSAYVKHERTHGPNGTIIKRYKCDECGNSFVDSCGLKKHVRIHTGERPYCCSVCQKTFSTSSTFVAHKRIHSGERPYKCENCDKMFITKSHLLTHRRTHTGEKPFSCQVCNRAFADGSSFRRHERLHTECLRTTKISNSHSSP